MRQTTHVQAEPPAVDRPPGQPFHRTRAAESPQQIERRVVVPLLDEPDPGRIVYRPAMLAGALGGAAIGAVVLGAFAWLTASGLWPIAGFGQFAAAGTGVATFTGAGGGGAAGALAGGLWALSRIPAYRAPLADN